MLGVRTFSITVPVTPGCVMMIEQSMLLFNQMHGLETILTSFLSPKLSLSINSTTSLRGCGVFPSLRMVEEGREQIDDDRHRGFATHVSGIDRDSPGFRGRCAVLIVHLQMMTMI